MAVRFSCSNCDKFIRVMDEKIGQKMICSGCGHTNKVPESDDIAMDRIGTRQREVSSGEPSARSAKDTRSANEVETATKDLLQEVIQAYHTTDAAGGAKQRPRIAVLATVQRYLIPVLVAGLFILAVLGAYFYGASLITN